MKRYERVRLYKGGEHAISILNTSQSNALKKLTNEYIAGIMESMHKASEGSLYHHIGGHNISDTHLTNIVTEYFWFIASEVHYEAIELPKDSVIQSLRIVVQAILYFLYGKWRTCYSWHNINCYSPEGPPYLTVDETRQKIGWVLTFRDGLLAALVLDDRDSAQKMLDWIQVDTCRDKSRIAQTDPSDVEYLMLLGHFFRTGHLDNVVSLKEAVRKGRCKRTQMMLDCLERIVTKDVKKFVSLFEKYLKHAFKLNLLFSHPDSPRSPAALTDIDASIIWTVALRSGLALPELPDELMDYVIRPQTLGFEVVD
jgi:hypothetical protein